MTEYIPWPRSHYHYQGDKIQICLVCKEIIPAAEKKSKNIIEE